MKNYHNWGLWWFFSTYLCQRVASPNWIFPQCWGWCVNPTSAQDSASNQSVSWTLTISQEPGEVGNRKSGRRTLESLTYGRTTLQTESECENGDYMLDWLHGTSGTCVPRWAAYVNEVGVADRLSVAETGSLENYWEPDDWTLKLPSSRSAWAPAELNCSSIRRLLFTMIITHTLPTTSREAPSWSLIASASHCSLLSHKLPYLFQHKKLACKTVSSW